MKIQHKDDTMNKKQNNEHPTNPFASGDVKAVAIVSECAKAMVENPNFWAEQTKKIKD